MLLVTPIVEPAKRPYRTVVFDAEGDLLSGLEADFGAGREPEPGIRTEAVQGFLEGWVNSEIPPVPLLIDNRPEFPCPGILGERAALVPELSREA